MKRGGRRNLLFGGLGIVLRLGVFRKLGWLSCGEIETPDVFIGIQAKEADVIGFRSADMADPDDPEAGLAPKATDFDGLAGSGHETHYVQTRSLLAEIDGVGRLHKRMASGIQAFDDDTKRFGDARILARSFPKVRSRLVERETDTGFAVGVGVQVGDADFLLIAAAFMDEKSGIAEIEPGLEDDEGAAGVDHERFRLFMEGPGFLGPAVNHHRHPERKPLAAARLIS